MLTSGPELPACEISEVTMNPPFDSAIPETFCCAADGSSTWIVISALRMILRLKASPAVCDFTPSSSETSWMSAAGVLAPEVGAALGAGMDFADPRGSGDAGGGAPPADSDLIGLSAAQPAHMRIVNRESINRPRPRIQYLRCY